MPYENRKKKDARRRGALETDIPTANNFECQFKTPSRSRIHELLNLGASSSHSIFQSLITKEDLLRLREVKIAFIIARTRNNVVVLFGTLKVQSFMLTEVRDCDLLIVVTSSTFLKRKGVLNEKNS